jgi:hypothetical protein
MYHRIDTEQLRYSIKHSIPELKKLIEQYHH